MFVHFVGSFVVEDCVAPWRLCIVVVVVVVAVVAVVVGRERHGQKRSRWKVKRMRDK